MRVEEKRRTSARGGSVPPAALAVIGLVIGIALGLLWGWVIQPVEYTNAAPSDLAPGGQRMWINMTADSLAFTGDNSLAQTRMSVFTAEQQAELLGEQIVEAQQQGDLAREQRLRNLADVISVTPGVAPGGEAAPTTPEAGAPDNLGSTLLMACGALLLVLILLLGGAIAFTRMRQSQAAGVRARPATSRNRASVGTPAPARRSEPPALGAPAEEEEGDDDLDRLFSETADSVEEATDDDVRELEFAEPEPAPVSYSPALDEFVTRYTYGDDGFDMSFSIETPQTEFLGECGVGISEVLNSGSPQQATAFEVWLFDKDDIRTVTKVLLSDYAWHNEELRNRLAPKGELVHIKEGDTLDLETKSLRVRARIREVDYGEGGVDRNAYFERLVVELTPQRKV